MLAFIVGVVCLLVGILIGTVLAICFWMTSLDDALDDDAVMFNRK